MTMHPGGQDSLHPVQANRLGGAPPVDRQPGAVPLGDFVRLVDGAPMRAARRGRQSQGFLLVAALLVGLAVGSSGLIPVSGRGWSHGATYEQAMDRLAQGGDTNSKEYNEALLMVSNRAKAALEMVGEAVLRESGDPPSCGTTALGWCGVAALEVLKRLEAEGSLKGEYAKDQVERLNEILDR